MSISDQPALRGRRAICALAVAGAACLALLAAPPGGRAIVFLDDEAVQLPDFDSRTAVVDPTQAQLDAVYALGASATWNSFGTPQSLVKSGGFLATDVQAADAGSAVEAWLAANAGLFKVASGLTVDRVIALDENDASVVILRQRFDGLVASPDGILSVGVVGTAATGFDVVSASSSVTGDDEVTGDTELSGAEAFVAAANGVGTEVSIVEVESVGTAQGWTELQVAGLRDTQLVRQVAFPTPVRGVVNAYDTFYTDGESQGYRQIVDAETGDVLMRESTVHSLADNPTWEAFPATPKPSTLGAYPWNYSSKDIRELWCWEKLRHCDRILENTSSPLAWDVDGITGLPTNTTSGNNSNAQEVWGPGTATGYRPISATRDYRYPWTNVWFKTKCDPANLTTPGVSNDINAAIVNLFAMHNRLHDWTYFLGFTETAWNAQQSNFGAPPPFLGNDPLIGRAQSGAITGSRDNANMNTRPDGTSSITNMFLWQPIAASFYPPCVDGDYDMSVIGHEYGHMVENRMIGKGIGRQGGNAGAMGESFGDLQAGEYLYEYDYVPVDGEDPTAVGPYATGNPERGIRNLDLDWTSAGKFPEPGKTQHVNSLTLGAYGYDIVGVEPHSDGEIWNAVNWDLRALLMDRYDHGWGWSHGKHDHDDWGWHKKDLQERCADGELTASKCPGNRRWIQLYFDAMLLMPRNPTFLVARDAILSADMMRFGGKNQDLIWRAFARRGFGSNATTTGTNDPDPRPGYESPLEEEGTLVFEGVAKDEAGAPPVTFSLFVGDYEARSTPIDHTANFVPDKRGYNFIARANGYGLVRFHVDGDDIRAGKTKTIRIYFPTNWASTTKGAVAAGDGVNHVRLIDDTEATNWQSTTGAVQGKQVTVAFDAPHWFDVVKVSAYLAAGQNRFSALRQFELHACTAGASTANPTCDPLVADGWRKILRSEKDAFPGAPPRPVAPDMQLRTWNIWPTRATHVKFVVLNTQCTGNPDFQGEQDNDTRSTTDCRSVLAGSEQVRAAELELLSSRAYVKGAEREE